MFCVIQQVTRKKPTPYGEYREIEAYQNEWRIAGDDRPCTWSYRYTGGRFERPHLEAYKISIHSSYREGGVVKKRQYPIRTMSYYDIVEWGLYDCADRRIQSTADKLGIGPAELYEIIEAKLEPLRERLEAEFHQSPEYIAKQEHERIIADHLTAQNKFCSKYDVDKDEYNRCYDVFGVLRNKEYLEQIKAQHKAQKRRYREADLHPLLPLSSFLVFFHWASSSAASSSVSSIIAASNSPFAGARPSLGTGASAWRALNMALGLWQLFGMALNRSLFVMVCLLIKRTDFPKLWVAEDLQLVHTAALLKSTQA